MFAQSHAVKCVTTEITIIEQVEVELWRFIVLFLDVPVVKLKNKRSASALLSLTHSISISHSCYKSINKNKKKKHRNLVGFFFSFLSGRCGGCKTIWSTLWKRRNKRGNAARHFHDQVRLEESRWNPMEPKETPRNPEQPFNCDSPHSIRLPTPI